MSNKEIKGRIHSFQSLGTVDGPGVRFVVFLQGCFLRCSCCHNPDTWDYNGGEEYTPSQVIQKVIRYKSYFGDKGGLTLSGGEPLLQPEFCEEILSQVKKEGINTCLDTSGALLNDQIKSLLRSVDRVLLDIKYTDEEKYQKYVKTSFQSVLKFLDYLEEIKVPVTIRQVIIPTINDDKENIEKLNAIARNYSVVDKIELLAFRKICAHKYDQMNLIFPFKDMPTPTKEEMDYFYELVDEKYKY